MQYRKMGSKIPWEASALGFGCMRLPSKKILGFIKKVNEPEAIRILRYAIDNGVNYVDTAYSYHMGKSEVIVGKALQGGYRQKVHLVTKLPIWKVKAAGDVEKFCREQLKKLQTEYLDIYLIHALSKGRFQLVKDLKLIPELEKLKEKGLIKHFGFSFHDNFQVFKEIVDSYDGWDACQIQWNYLDQDTQATTKGLEYAASKGLAVIIMEPLKGGHLANPKPEVKVIFDKAPVQRTPVDWALQFVWNRPEVSLLLSGMSAFDQVKQNLESADKSGVGKLLSKELDVIKQVGDVLRKSILIPCTACEYCITCPSGVAIPRNFAILNSYSSHKNLKNAKKEYSKLAASKDALNAAKDNGMATLCTKCKKCMEKCPQAIDIPGELEKVNAVLTGAKPIEQVFFKKE